jgi:CheY-like chemotaxis protein
MSDLMQMIIVEDDQAVRADTVAHFHTRYVNQIYIHQIPDWPQAQSMLPELIQQSHLVLSDINLKGDNAGEGFVRTEFDGLRVFGLARKNNPSIPIVLYTAHALAQHALDQFDQPDGPVWVVRKTGQEEIEACADRLASVAENLIWSISLQRREEALTRLSNEDATVLSEPADVGLPSWKSMLAVLAARTNPLDSLEPAALSGYLARFLPGRSFKFSLLARMFKPRDYRWAFNDETFSIAPPKARIKVTRSAWEELLHIVEKEFGEHRANWQRGWSSSVKDAHRELAGCRHVLMRSTVDALDSCLNAARELDSIASKDEVRFGLACRDYMKAHVKVVSDLLRRNWHTTLKNLFKCELNNSLMHFPLVAEWDKLAQGVNYVCISSAKHSNSLPDVRLIITNPNDHQWEYTILISDSGPGIQEYAAAFSPFSSVRPVEDIGRNHKLQLAQRLLWGYCDWSTVTKRDGEADVRFHNAFRANDNGSEVVSRLNDEIQKLRNAKSGTLHVLSFRCPSPISGEYKHETVDLRFEG